MEAAAMVRCAHILVRIMKEDLAAARAVEPKFVLLHDHGCDLIAYDPAPLKNTLGKAAIQDSLRRRASQMKAPQS